MGQADVAGEVSFLRGEVHSLEQVICAVRRTCEQDTARHVRAISLAHEQLDALRESEVRREAELLCLCDQIAALEEEREVAGETGVAQARECATLATAFQLLRTELRGEEFASRMAREAEGCALSIAKTYRNFAIQGATQLERVEAEMLKSRKRVEARLSHLGATAQASLRQRSLRILLNLAASEACAEALRRWMASTAAMRRAEAYVVGISAAVRREVTYNTTHNHRMKTQLKSERMDAAKTLHEANTKVGRLEQEIARLRMDVSTAEEKWRQAEEGKRIALSTLVSLQGSLPPSQTHTSFADDTEMADHIDNNLTSPSGSCNELDCLRREVEALRDELSQKRELIRQLKIMNEETEMERRFCERALRDERRVAEERTQREAALMEEAAMKEQCNAELHADLTSLLSESTETRLAVVDALLCTGLGDYRPRWSSC